MIHLDTHVVVWLANGDHHRLSRRARLLASSDLIRVSPMVSVELQTLHEIGRLREPASQILDTLFDALGLRMAESPFYRVAHKSWGLDWTRDPFDRLIAAHAMADDVPLVTKDPTLLEHCPVAVWE